MLYIGVLRCRMNLFFKSCPYNIVLKWTYKKTISTFYYYWYYKNRYFRVSQGLALSAYFPVRAGVPQGSILVPILYSLYTADIPLHPHTTLSSFADDEATLSRSTDPITTSNDLPEHLHSLQSWFRKWKVKVNPEKSVHSLYRNLSVPPPPHIPMFLSSLRTKLNTWAYK